MYGSSCGKCRFMKNSHFDYSGTTRSTDIKMCLWVHRQVCGDKIPFTIRYHLATASSSTPAQLPLSNVVGNPNFLSCGSMLNGNCSRGPWSSVTVNGAMLPALANSGSAYCLNHLEKKRKIRRYFFIFYFIIELLFCFLIGALVSTYNRGLSAHTCVVKNQTLPIVDVHGRTRSREGTK